jgi:hypothetical protein
VIVGVAVTFAAACTPDIDAPPPGTPPATIEENVVLGRGSLVVGEQSTEYELVRLGREDGRATYVQWVRPLPADRGHASVVVQTLPYEGVDWSGDPVDEALAAAGPRSDGFYNDSACDDDNDRGVAYFAVSPEESATNAITHVLNGHGTLLVFGRYYACDAIVPSCLFGVSVVVTAAERQILDAVGTRALDDASADAALVVVRAALAAVVDAAG